MGLFDFFKSEKIDKKQEPLFQEKSRLLVLETILHAVDKYHEGEYSKAILFFDEVLSIDPSNNEYVLFYYRGCSNYYLDNNREALNDIEKAIEISETSEAYNQKGIILMEFEDNLQSMLCFDTAISLDKENVDAYESRAKLKSNLKDSNGAIQDYDKVIVLDPNNSLAYYRRGTENFTLGNYEEATKNLDKAIEIGLPSYSRIKLENLYSFRGSFKMLLRLYDLAIEDFSKVLELTPNSVSTYFDRAEAYYFLDNYKEAIKDLNEIIRLEPENGKAYFKRCEAKKELMDINPNYKDEAVLDKIQAYKFGYDEDDD